MEMLPSRTACTKKVSAVLVSVTVTLAKFAATFTTGVPSVPIRWPPVTAVTSLVATVV